MTATILTPSPAHTARAIGSRSCLIEGRSGAATSQPVTNGLAQAMTGEWIYTVWRGQRRPSLIDLRQDATSVVDVAGQFPEIEKRLHEAVVSFMRRQGTAASFIDGYAT